MKWPTSITMRAFPPDASLDECLDVAKDAGFDAVEVNLEPWFTVDLDSSDAEVAAFGASVVDHGLKVSSVYSREQWKNSITSDDPITVERGRAIVRRLAACATTLAAQAVLVVPGGVDTSLYGCSKEVVSYEVAYARARRELQNLAEELRRAGSEVVLCVENVWNKFLLSPLEMRQFIDEIGSENVGVFFDVGNILRYGYPDQWIRILGPRIKRVHFKDFRLAIDNSSGFGGLLQGDVDWPAVMRALRDVGYDSYLTAEVMPPYAYAKYQLVRDSGAALRLIQAMGE